MSKATTKTKKDIVNDTGPTPQNAKVEEFKGHVQDSPDFKQFLEICKLTGDLEGEFEDLELEEKKSIEVGFHQWLKAGKPKPTMPEIPQGKVEYTIDIWIASYKGKKFVYYDTNLGKKHWVEEKNGRSIKFETEATDEVLNKLLKERDELCPLEQPRHQYVVIGTQVHLIPNEADLLKSYDELVQIARKAS